MLCIYELCCIYIFFFFFNDTATTEIYTLSLHDALPICDHRQRRGNPQPPAARGGLRHRRELLDELPGVPAAPRRGVQGGADRKSTRLNSSHDQISYAVFCLKKKKIQPHGPRMSASTQSS